jgi:hypothetical protein
MMMVDARALFLSNTAEDNRRSALGRVSVPPETIPLP